GFMGDLPASGGRRGWDYWSGLTTSPPAGGSRADTTPPSVPKRRGRTAPSPNTNNAPPTWGEPPFVGDGGVTPSWIIRLPQRSVPPLPPEKIGSFQYQLPVLKERRSSAFSPTRMVLDRPSLTSSLFSGRPATGTPPAGQRLMRK